MSTQACSSVFDQNQALDVLTLTSSRPSPPSPSPVTHNEFSLPRVIPPQTDPATTLTPPPPRTTTKTVTTMAMATERRPRMISGDMTDANDMPIGTKRPSAAVAVPAAASPSSEDGRPAKKARRGVTFSTTLQTTRLLERAADEDEDDVHRSLLHTTQLELDATRSTVRNLVFLVRSGAGAMLGDDVCLRGLENLLEPSAKEARARVRKSHVAVLAIQHYLKSRPRRQGHGPATVARIYGDYARPSVEEALARGQADAEAVREKPTGACETER